MKYGFVASPYPNRISADVHGGLADQDMIAEIIEAVFGEVLVKDPVYEQPMIEHPPNSGELKGRIFSRYISYHQYQGEDADMSVLRLHRD